MAIIYFLVQRHRELKLNAERRAKESREKENMFKEKESSKIERQLMREESQQRSKEADAREKRAAADLAKRLEEERLAWEAQRKEKEGHERKVVVVLRVFMNIFFGQERSIAEERARREVEERMREKKWAEEEAEEATKMAMLSQSHRGGFAFFENEKKAKPPVFFFRPLIRRLLEPHSDQAAGKRACRTSSRRGKLDG